MVLPPARLALTARVRAAAVLLALLAGPLRLAAQSGVAPGPGPYDPAVPTVTEIRGFATGMTFSTYRDVERVVDRIAAAAAERVRVETYGTTPEGRPLRLVWVSDPANLSRLDALRAANAALMRGGEPAPDAPIFVWLSFGVHGDEAAGPEAALELLYHLAAARDAETRSILRRVVVAIDPLLNPDGHERYVGWYRASVGAAPDPDPAAREHRPPWPDGRTNHWYFDLNRDWAWGIQPETRARRAAYLATLPQVHVDFHEMDAASTYFFFPPATPVHAFYPPSTEAWSRIFGAANAAAFDARGWPYYTEEEFDLFYPGYGDSWPSFFGATGMTYEQAGGGRAGVLLARADGTQLSLSDRVLHHLEAARTTIATAARHRRERLADFAAFWRAGSRRPAGSPGAYLLPRGPDAEALAAALAAQGVLVDTLAGALAADSLERYDGVEPLDSLPAGTLLLRGDQPLGRFLAALMVPGGAPPDTSEFYDITAWSLPYLFGVPALRAAALPAVALGRWDGPAPVLPSVAPPGTVAFVWPYRSTGDVLAAARLLAAGWRVRVAERGFALGGRRWGAGTFVLPVEQPDSLAAAPEALARVLAAFGAQAVPLISYRTDDGIDLGSNWVRTLERPRVALAAGPGVEETSLGGAWHLLAVEAGIDLDVVRLADLGTPPGTDPESVAGREPLSLSDYTAIILPDGPSAAAYEDALDARGAARLREWVESGGTLIGVRAGAAVLAQQRWGLAPVQPIARSAPSAARRRSSRGRATDEERERIPGTLVLALVDTTAVLGYGFGAAATVLVRDPVELALAAEGNAWIYADAEPRAGYLPESARRRLPSTPYAVALPRGQGHVVLFADDPAFRGILHALKRLYLNAVLLLPGAP